VHDFVLDEAVGRKYLLGELSVEDQHRIEELTFLEPRSLELLQELENELIDDYISHDLATSERHRFETYFLSKPGHRSDLRIAMALQTYIDRNEPAISSPSNEHVRPAQRDWLWKWLQAKLPLPVPVLGALAVLMFIAALLLGLRLLRNSQFHSPIQANRETTKPEQGPKEESEAVVSTPSPPLNQNAEAIPRAQRVTTPRSESRVLSFLLVPGAPTRGDGDTTNIPLPVRSTQLRFDLPLIDENDYELYQVELQAEQGNELSHWRALRSQTGSTGKLVRVMVSSQILKAHQRYRLVLTGVASDTTPHTLAYYYFRTAD
jgi:hypothetical protein